jgi:NAD(P)-dependent dehydrogenase (short-subunit alcohol dehydrogenase family)
VGADHVVRQELAPHGIDVTALHVGYMDTDMSDYIDAGEKSDPAVIAAAALHGIAAGAKEIIAEEITQGVKQQLSATPVAAQTVDGEPRPDRGHHDFQAVVGKSRTGPKPSKNAGSGRGRAGVQSPHIACL